MCPALVPSIIPPIHLSAIPMSTRASQIGMAENRYPPLPLLLEPLWMFIVTSFYTFVAEPSVNSHEIMDMSAVLLLKPFPAHGAMTIVFAFLSDHSVSSFGGCGNGIQWVT